MLNFDSNINTFSGELIHQVKQSYNFFGWKVGPSGGSDNQRTSTIICYGRVANHNLLSIFVVTHIGIRQKRIWTRYFKFELFCTYSNTFIPSTNYINFMSSNDSKTFIPSSNCSLVSKRKTNENAEHSSKRHNDDRFVDLNMILNLNNGLNNWYRKFM